MRRGVAPSPFPTAGTTFPLDTLLFNASLFSFSRGVAYSLPPSRYACHLPHGGRQFMHVARESTVVAGPISDRLYVEVNAI